MPTLTFKKLHNILLTITDECLYGHIGKRSKILKPMRIIGKRRIYIGNDVTILNLARIETIRVWGGKLLNGKLFIGDGTSIEQCCHIIAAKNVEIGKGCVFSAYVYVSDCSHGYMPEKEIMQTHLEIKPVKVGDYCFIGIGTCIMPGVNIGSHVVVGANSVVTHDIPDYMMVAGSPARIIKKYNLDSGIWENFEHR